MLGGMTEYEQYRGLDKKLSNAQRKELIDLLSSCDPKYFPTLLTKTEDNFLREVLRYYGGISKDAEAAIWQRRRTTDVTVDVPAEELVEDTGLRDDGNWETVDKQIEGGAPWRPDCYGCSRR